MMSATARWSPSSSLTCWQSSNLTPPARPMYRRRVQRGPPALPRGQPEPRKTKSGQSPTPVGRVPQHPNARKGKIPPLFLFLLHGALRLGHDLLLEVGRDLLVVGELHAVIPAVAGDGPEAGVVLHHLRQGDGGLHRLVASLGLDAQD